MERESPTRSRSAGEPWGKIWTHISDTVDRVLALLFPERELPRPYRTCMVLGHVADREGKKESKSKGNYTPPEVILDRVRLEFAVVVPPDEEPDRARNTRALFWAALALAVLTAALLLITSSQSVQDTLFCAAEQLTHAAR